jgi:hypothetical protein
VTAELVPATGGSGEAFSLHLAGARPSLEGVAVAPVDTLHHASDPLTIALTAQALPRRFEVRMRQAPQTGTPCDALLDDATAVAVPASDVHRDSASGVDVTLHAGDILHDDAFGTLQIQIVDTVTQRASDWTDLAGQFAQ